mmetsp:Transcript_12104/g.27733  ORF Transcript_12104/g.27733 Transcript_12104/m.27733 type:complete len:238 (-) Transcript_12104:349-1062(-)
MEDFRAGASFSWPKLLPPGMLAPAPELLATELFSLGLWERCAFDLPSLPSRFFPMSLMGGSVVSSGSSSSPWASYIAGPAAPPPPVLICGRVLPPPWTESSSIPIPPRSELTTLMPVVRNWVSLSRWYDRAVSSWASSCRGGEVTSGARSRASSLAWAFSASRRSLKYGCFSACLADNLSSGLYANNRTISSCSSADACGISRANPVPSWGWKLKSMCDALRWNFWSTSWGGVPIMA